MKNDLNYLMFKFFLMYVILLNLREKYLNVNILLWYFVILIVVELVFSNILVELEVYFVVFLRLSIYLFDR